MSGRAHPRSRGENGAFGRARSCTTGSSPLTRGKHPDDGADGGGLGLIPAHAGKTVQPAGSARASRAHPRSRGENNKSQIGSHAPLGSSPLTRGKRRTRRGRARTTGLIPAHAGKTFFLIGYPDGQPAHPRSRGENGRAPVARGDEAGSSPLTRGKHPASAARRADPGLIPAHAGKTYSTSAVAYRSRAHPRSRGENWQWIAGIATEVGSSPLTRGKRGEAGRDDPRAGLIPAHAGKTLIGGGDERVHWAHPRSRGENTS